MAKRNSCCLMHSQACVSPPLSPTPVKMQLHHLLHANRSRMHRSKSCAIDNCHQVARIDGLCTKHNMQFSSKKRKCTVDDCAAYARSGGLCARHGGGKACTIPGCKSVACSTQGLCRLHTRTEAITPSG
ncbi:hypothetical protein LEN26_008175 [Aphanomyces euteiches]|uniref:WRKY19-like zinc finger domain-containing protein n=1 Tax=Aphanomyces euteiches TaxID=100861 RepID=A0A6G0XUE4_9STRA|nr:hypothetical protein Ae201684_000772 [Aphanomyces euteiches]KAH9099310.1 hypothetical protein Ae201684P_018326 [Aphanomyces euteiches]KAH9119549.1 hypothetical protein AeMF1_007819 [Aphanomyces euteiches]KAH9130814.1 hypothetical protein LEN26_008175 [Aphanomyces euteiches]KAH9142148.1 hypothetical protein AeRB84_013762 [Aphanomyces euteiches]